MLTEWRALGPGCILTMLTKSAVRSVCTAPHLVKVAMASSSSSAARLNWRLAMRSTASYTCRGSRHCKSACTSSMQLRGHQPHRLAHRRSRSRHEQRQRLHTWHTREGGDLDRPSCLLALGIQTLPPFNAAALDQPVISHGVLIPKPGNSALPCKPTLSLFLRSQSPPLPHNTFACSTQEASASHVSARGSVSRTGQKDAGSVASTSGRWAKTNYCHCLLLSITGKPGPMQTRQHSPGQSSSTSSAPARAQPSLPAGRRG